LFAGGAPELRPGERRVIEALREVETDETTPIEALALLDRLVSELRAEGER
jgi:hypothetical protein